MNHSTPPSEDDKPRQVLDAALRLQAERDAAVEESRRLAALRDAASEVGVAPEVFDEAARALQRRQGEEADRAEAAMLARRRKLRRAGLVATIVLPVIACAFIVVWPYVPREPVRDGFDGVGTAWTLGKNASTRAILASDQVEGHGAVAVLVVERFGPDADGKFHAAVNAGEPVDLRARTGLRVAMRAEGLATARVFLEDGELRWRSQPLALGGAWQTYDLALATFEKQERSGHVWHVVSPSAPRRGRVSFKFGWFMNPQDATGRVWIDDLEVH